MRMNISDIGILIVLVYFVLAGIIAGLFSEAAKEKGYSSSEYFWACFLLGLAGWLLVIALPDRDRGVGASAEQPELRPGELPEL